MGSFSMLVYGFFINIFLIFFTYKYVVELKLIDYPNKRKTHGKPIPVNGGLCIFLTSLIYLIFNSSSLFILFSHKEVLAIVLSFILFFVVGIFDDIKKLSSKIKIIVQLVTAFIITFGLNFNHIQIIPFIQNSIINTCCVIFFILFVTNAINMIDGLDNLASGLSIIILISFILLFSNTGNLSIIYFLMIITGALLSIIIYSNFCNRIFLGDSGSLFLGLLFSIVSLLYIKYSHQSFIIIPSFILFLPILDVIYLIFYRFLGIKEKTLSLRFCNIFKSDRNHIHHHLLDLGISSKYVCLFLYLISIFLSIFVIMIDNFNYLNIMFYLFMILYFLFRTIVAVKK